jgi:formamidopyrimidine-DNA glycosylase
MGPGAAERELFRAHLAAALKGRSAPVKALLLDQRIVAGLGNIYVCEALHMAGIAPARAGGRISQPRLELLVEAIKAVLAAAIEAGDPRFATMPGRTGSSAIFSSSGGSTAGRKGLPLRSAYPPPGGRRALDLPLRRLPAVEG